AAQSPPASSGSTGGALPNRSVTPPVITVDLTKFATDFGASFQVQADSLEMMASGKTLNAQQSTAYFEAQNNGAKIAVQLSDLLQKNPRWQRATTEALEANAKKGIIALYHAEKAFKKAKDSRSAGSTTGKCPAEISKYVNDQYLIVTRIRGLMPYSKDEMATPNSKNVPANSDSK
ncbi:MAG: hypothetical protein RLZZ386_1347, partial [Planctomycetota bacterium]